MECFEKSVGWYCLKDLVAQQRGMRFVNGRQLVRNLEHCRSKKESNSTVEQHTVQSKRPENLMYALAGKVRREVEENGTRCSLLRY